MSTVVNRIDQEIKAIQARVMQIPRPRNVLLHQLCKDVVVGTQQPICIYAGYTTCCLSCVSCKTCINLTWQAKNAQQTEVLPLHIKVGFSNFFLMLWYCSKLEFVLRSCARAMV